MSSQRFKYLALGITCFILGAMFLQPAAAHIIASKNAHTLAKKHLSYFAARSWVKNNYLPKTRTYSRTQSNNRFLAKTDAASTYLTQANASSTYLSQANASSTYYPLTGGSVSGEVTADNYNYSAAVTKTISISAASLQGPNDLVLGWDGNEQKGAYKISGGAGYSDNFAKASISLPNGAVITKFTAYFYDNDGGVNTISSGIERNNLSSGDFEQMTAVGTSGLASPGYEIKEDISINYATIDNNNYSYYVYSFLFSSTANLTVKGYKIDYQITEP